MLSLRNYIGGQLCVPQTGRYIDVWEPARGEVWAEAPDSGPEDVAAAVAAAKEAFPAWSRSSAQERAELLMAIAAGIRQRFEALAAAESRDSGKPLALARRMDIPRAEENFRFFAHACTQFHSETFDMGSGFNYVLRRPAGVAALISPWNLPLYLFSWKIAPALAAGCCAVAKPSEITPVTAHMLSEICIEAGLPPGVLNIVHGSGPGAGQALVAHPDISLISFTGSTATGRSIAATAAPQFKKLSLELGGKNAAVVFADCDYEATIEGLLRASFTNQGQICLCASRILVEKTIYERFLSDFVARVRAMKTGDPQAADTRIGAIVSQAQYEKDLSYLQLARELGGEIHCGGERPADLPAHCEKGWFLSPAVITGLPMDCRVNQEEIFGPVVTVQAFDSEEEALHLANSTRYGLAATVWTSHLKKAHRVAARLEAGIVWINDWLVRDLRTPFGGVKQSGVGREGGNEALRFFTEAKNIYLGE